MMLRDKTGIYIVENKVGCEVIVLEFSSRLKTDLKVNAWAKNGTKHSSSTYPISKEYELENGSRLIKDGKSQFCDPTTNHTFIIKSFKAIDAQEIT